VRGAVGTAWRAIRNRTRVRPAIVVLPALALLAVAWLCHEPLIALVGSLRETYRATMPIAVREAVYAYVHRTASLLLDPVVYTLVAVVCLLERRFPAQPNQPLLSRGMAQDYAWFVAEKLVFVHVIALYASVLEALYDTYLGFLTLPVATWSTWARGLCTIVVGDFLSWAHHYLRHKVGVFWAFHVIHHSQRQMNFFADYRVHVVELTIAQTILFVPIHIFAMRFPDNAYLLFAFTWYTRVYHANLRSNFGWLKHVLVTPQSHRVHHSIERKHWDRNFGVIFTVWDRMFGTLHADYDEYPATGVADATFPWEGGRARRGVLRTLWAQTCYPFAILARFRGRRDARWWTTEPGAT
jgi:sterol desaturase/sphingolipid hydroxylase (fatty acid hydroxylase superfamily)